MQSLQSGVRAAGKHSRLGQQSARVSGKRRIEITRETYEAPAWASQRLLTLGGKNRFGDPNYRLVWGWNRLEWIGGKFEDRDSEGRLIREVFALRREPKYPNANRWYIEQWLPPEKYGSPVNWYRQTREWDEGGIAQLGPYPERGEYELCCVIETGDAEFAQLESYMIDEFFWELNKKKRVSYQQGVINRKEAIAKRMRRDAQQAHEVLNETTKPSFNDGMYVTVA